MKPRRSAWPLCTLGSTAFCPRHIFGGLQSIRIYRSTALTMLKSEIKPRSEYAFREKRVPGCPLERVRVLEHIRRQQVESKVDRPRSWSRTLRRIGPACRNLEGAQGFCQRGGEPRATGIVAPAAAGAASTSLCLVPFSRISLVLISSLGISHESHGDFSGKSGPHMRRSKVLSKD